jgi:CelD/BcsL family acetyltransferase involved in cellulose biosynthesis
MPVLEILKGRRVFETLENEWRALAEDDPAATPFQTWEWQSIWFKHYGAGKEPWAVCVREGRDLVGLMTLVKTTGAWRVLRSLGVGPSDYLHPLVRSQEAVQEMREFLRTVKGVDLVDLHQIRENHALLESPSEGLEQANCLVLDLPNSYQDFVSNLGKSLRYDVKKLDRTVIDTKKAIVEHVARERVQAGFEAFLEQHKARWRSKRLPGAFVGRSVRFHREWVETASQRDWLRLRLLRVDGRIIGAIYAMAFHKTVFYYQAGFDPEMNAYSPGNLLVAQTIREAIEEGRAQFDFMRGDESYKRRWKPQHSWSNRRILLARSPLLGSLGIRWNFAGYELEKKVRARLEGPDGKRDNR